MEIVADCYEKHVIANQPAGWCGNPHSLRQYHIVQFCPIWISTFNQLILPFSVPSFDLLFPFNSCFYI